MSTRGRTGDGEFRGPVIRSDGLAVSFSSYADDPVPGDTDGTVDVVVRHLR
ncbi:hypothetical protein ACYF6T_24970 [Streptomyces sp. 7R007]